MFIIAPTPQYVKRLAVQHGRLFIFYGDSPSATVTHRGDTVKLIILEEGYFEKLYRLLATGEIQESSKAS